MLLPPKTLHGVFLSIFGHGVMLQGPSGCGKSDTALALLSRGHRLIADDAVMLMRQENTLIGHCPAALQNLLEIRALGIVDVRAIFGEQAILASSRLELVIEFIHPLSPAEQCRRRPTIESFDKVIMGLPIKHIPLPLALCHNVAIVIESAVRLAVIN